MTGKPSATSLTITGTFHFGPFVLKMRLNFVNFSVPRRISGGTGQERGGKKETGERKRPGQGNWQRKRKRKEKKR